MMGKLVLTFSWIMSQDGQAHFKNPAAFAARFLKWSDIMH